MEMEVLDKRLQIMVSEWHLKEVEAYRRSRDPIPSRGQAVRELIEEALKNWRKSQDK